MNPTGKRFKLLLMLLISYQIRVDANGCQQVINDLLKRI
jgi:hypothetical protein